MRLVKPLPVDFGWYALNALKRSACSYYRIDVPARALYDAGLANTKVEHRINQDLPEAMDHMLSSDVIVFFALSGKTILEVISALKNVKPGLDDLGQEMIYPPIVIHDMDDNLDWVHPFNEAFVRLGIRNWNGDMLNPGDQLTVQFEKDKSTVPLWQDKITQMGDYRFDIERNRRDVETFFEGAKQSDGVTVPSPALARYYREEKGCQEVYVYPNSIIPADYPVAKLQPHDGVRILWQGGSSHMVDWFPLRDAVRTVALKYPQAKFVIWGTKYDWIHDNIPPEQIEMVDWVDYPGYKAQRVLVDCDINLCPLADNTFNAGKSAIKFYESTMPHVPEATLASRVAPYSEEIEDGKTGLLYDSPEDFVNKLSTLIENVELRRSLGEEARQWVLVNRHYLKTITGYHDFLQHLKSKQRMELLAEV